MTTQHNQSADLLRTYASARAAVFRIHVDPEAGERGWVGSGFFISASGYALTAYHNLPFQVRKHREGHVRGRDSLGKPLLLKFIPMVGDEDHDVALLQASEGGPHAHVSLATVRPEFSDRERIQFWAMRQVQVLGFPLKESKQVEEPIPGFVSSDRPWGTVVETVNGVPTGRIYITPEKAEDLNGISGGPVVDLETDLVVAVAEAFDRVQRKLRASPVRPWPVGLPGLDLPAIRVIPARPNRTWMVVVLGLITFAAVGLLYWGFFDRAPGSNSSAPQATTPTSEPTVPPVAERATSVPDAPRPDVRATAPDLRPAREASAPESACDVTVTTGLPYDEFGGSHTCGFEIAGTVTPAPTPRDVILFVTAGRDVPETRYLGRFAVGAGASDWRIPGSCKGARYSVAVAVSGALPALDRSRSVPVPRPGQDGVSCVETFEGQR